MPLYEFQCPNCKKVIEEFGKITEEIQPPNCPDCLIATKQLISTGVGFRFAEPFSVYGHDGTLLHRRQTTEKTPPPDHRWGKESNLAEV